MLFLTSWSHWGNANPSQETVASFSWEGLSLSMSPDEFYSALEGDGYTQMRSTGTKKKVSVYRRKTEGVLKKVQVTEKNGNIIKFSFNETRVGRRKNALTADAANEIYSNIKSKFDFDDSVCRPSPNGGGTCNVQFDSSTHKNRINVNVKPRIIKIVLSSVPFPQSVVDANQQLASGLESAYACFGTTDITSVKEIYNCIRSSSQTLSKLPQRNQGIRLENPTLDCPTLTDYYKKALSQAKDGSAGDTSEVPDCKTFAAVIERATGKPPYWADCIDPSDDDESFKNCVAGYAPALVNSRTLNLPSCEAVQKAYKIGVIGAQPEKNLKDVQVPDCDYVMAQAKSWRGPLPDNLKGCEGYDPDNITEHLMNCITSENEILGFFRLPASPLSL